MLGVSLFFCVMDRVLLQRAASLTSTEISFQIADMFLHRAGLLAMNGEEACCYLPWEIQN